MLRVRLINNIFLDKLYLSCYMSRIPYFSKKGKIKLYIFSPVIPFYDIHDTFARI